MLELELGEGMVPGTGVTVCTGNEDLSRSQHLVPTILKPDQSNSVPSHVVLLGQWPQI